MRPVLVQLVVRTLHETVEGDVDLPEELARGFAPPLSNRTFEQPAVFALYKWSIHGRRNRQRQAFQDDRQVAITVIPGEDQDDRQADQECEGGELLELARPVVGALTYYSVVVVHPALRLAAPLLHA